MSDQASEPATTSAPAPEAELRRLIDEALEERDGAFNKKNKITIIAWDGHLDRVWPTLILSTIAAASGMDVSVFFTFWGLFALAKPGKRTGKDWMTKATPLLVGARSAPVGTPSGITDASSA